MWINKKNAWRTSLNQYLQVNCCCKVSHFLQFILIIINTIRNTNLFCQSIHDWNWQQWLSDFFVRCWQVGILHICYSDKDIKLDCQCVISPPETLWQTTNNNKQIQYRKSWYKMHEKTKVPKILNAEENFITESP